MWKLKYLLKLRHTDSRIILGGSAFSLMSQDIFTCLDADFGIVGEGERASKVCHRSGLSFCHSLLIGGAGETMETVQRTFDAILAMSRRLLAVWWEFVFFPEHVCLR